MKKALIAFALVLALASCGSSSSSAAAMETITREEAISYLGDIASYQAGEDYADPVYGTYRCLVSGTETERVMMREDRGYFYLSLADATSYGGSSNLVFAFYLQDGKKTAVAEEGDEKRVYVAGDDEAEYLSVLQSLWDAFEPFFKGPASKLSSFLGSLPAEIESESYEGNTEGGLSADISYKDDDGVSHPMAYWWSSYKMVSARDDVSGRYEAYSYEKPDITTVSLGADAADMTSEELSDYKTVALAYLSDHLSYASLS